LPPAVLLFVKAAESAPLRTKKTLSFALAITLITSICVAKADLIWAQAYRQGAQYISLKGYRPGVFAGHFGFQWYAEKAGLTPLNVDEPMPEGFLVVARFADAQIVGNEDAKRLTLLEAKDMQSSFPFRVMAPAARAGFYSSFWGVLPYSISHTAVETFLYYRVSPKKG
jgi:hypothetical protein